MSVSWVHRFVRLRPIHAFGAIYANALEHSLRAWGIRYDDLTPEGNEDYFRAVRLLPTDVSEARDRRLGRCVDMSAKHVHLDGEAYEAQQPWAVYVAPLVEDLEKRRYERETYR